MTPTFQDRARVASLMADEQAHFASTHPRSRQLFDQGAQHWLYGAPSHWMRRWIGGCPIYLDERVHENGER